MQLDPWALAVCTGAFGLMAALGLLLVARLRATGDEPWYLLQAYSLLHHRTADLSAVLRDRSLRLQILGTAPDDHTRTYLGHGPAVVYYMPGYAAVIAPLYALGGRALVAICQALAAALTAALVFIEAQGMFGARRAALFGCLAYVLPLPVLLYVGQIFPSTLATCGMFAGYVLVTRGLPAARGWRLLALGAAVGGLACVLPWLHLKYALTAVVLVAVGVVVVRPQLCWPVRAAGANRSAWCAAALMVGLLILTFGGLALYSHATFGVWIPPNARQQPSVSQLRMDQVAAVYSDMFFGQQSGLIPWVPLDLLVLPGLVLVWRRHGLQGRAISALLIAQLATFLSAAASPVFQGKAMPARFTVECAPLFALCVAAVFARAIPAQAISLAAIWNRMGRRGIWEVRASCASRDPRPEVGRRRAVRVAAALISLGLLAVTGWFAAVGQLDPARLYPGPSGARLAEEYPQALPEGWFVLFPSPQGQWVTHGILALSPVSKTALTAQGLGGKKAVLGLPGRVPAGALMAQSRRVLMPPGRYRASFLVACDHTASPGTALRLLVGRGTGRRLARIAKQQMQTARCAGANRPIQVPLPFTSNGFEPLDFAVEYGGTTPVAVWWVAYAPAPT